jgi:AcrR family transcriptional regulator
MRRAEHKAVTRSAISGAAQRLVSSRPYDTVTVTDIAREAGVGYRTFYRYFSGKEDAALAGLADFLDLFVDHVRDRPVDETPMASLLAALDAVALEIRDVMGPEFGELLVTGLALVETVPAVAAHQHWLAVRAQDTLTDVFAERLGLPVDALLPRIHAAAATAAYHAATRTWARLAAGERTPERVWQLGRATLEAFAFGLDPSSPDALYRLDVGYSSEPEHASPPEHASKEAVPWAAS